MLLIVDTHFTNAGWPHVKPYDTVVKSTILEWDWIQCSAVRFLTFLGLCFLINKREVIIVPTSEGFIKIKWSHMWRAVKSSALHIKKKNALVLAIVINNKSRNLQMGTFSQNLINICINSDNAVDQRILSFCRKESSQTFLGRGSWHIQVSIFRSLSIRQKGWSYETQWGSIRN